MLQVTIPLTKPLDTEVSKDSDAGIPYCVKVRFKRLKYVGQPPTEESEQHKSNIARTLDN